MKSKALRLYVAGLVFWLCAIGLFWLYPFALELAVDQGWIGVACSKSQIESIQTIVTEGLANKDPVEKIGLAINAKWGDSFFSQLVVDDGPGYETGSIMTFHGMPDSGYKNAYATRIEGDGFLVELYPVLYSFFRGYETFCLVAAAGAGILGWRWSAKIPVEPFKRTLFFASWKAMPRQLLGVFGGAIVSFALVFGLLFSQRTVLARAVSYAVDLRKDLRTRLDQIEKDIQFLSKEKDIKKAIRLHLPSTSQAFLYERDGVFLGEVVRPDSQALAGVDALEPLYASHYLSTKKGENLLVLSAYPFYWLVPVYTAFAFGYAGLLVLFWLKEYMDAQIGRIGALQFRVQAFALGDWKYAIEKKDGDELNQLGNDLESMRQSYLEKTKVEQDARAANQALITGLSHDLRTPLTVLKGYLEILELDRFQDESARARYIALANQKVDHIRVLSDRMFETALVQDKSVSVRRKPVLASDIVQALKERIERLQSKGFIITSEMKTSVGSWTLDWTLFERIADNVFSNLEKYADPRHPIQIHFTIEKELRWVTVNRKRKSEQAEHHGIGLASVRQMIETQGGALTIEESKTTFKETIVLSRPRRKNDPAERVD
ncbi:HAMP domain-containing sensor histidine kinase [uncultured Dubosiella sp.]|uniref:sensor histidine kinase n=1 Tax=uncultured Dubosiella sp. TaxID=1937011 RepID=UPI002730139A|nr:HAMP domain-containing sensor histidine kinase [uncultured Dubosiella sp.]